LAPEPAARWPSTAMSTTTHMMKAAPMITPTNPPTAAKGPAHV